MQTTDAAYRPSAGHALAAALILLAFGLLVVDPELMSLATLPVIVIGAIAYE